MRDSSSTIGWLRSFRLGGIALFDLVLTWVITAWLLKKYVGFFMALPVGVAIGIVAHWLFGVKTALNQKIEKMFE